MRKSRQFNLQRTARQFKYNYKKKVLLHFVINVYNCSVLSIAGVSLSLGVALLANKKIQKFSYFLYFYQNNDNEKEKGYFHDKQNKLLMDKYLTLSLELCKIKLTQIFTFYFTFSFPS